MAKQPSNPPVKMAEEVADRVVAALSPRFDALDDEIASVKDEILILKDGQKAHTAELLAVRDMLDTDTASVDEIDRLKGKLERLERRLVKVERDR